MGQPKITQSLIFSGRIFSVKELELIQEISADFASLGRTEISRTVCELLEWKRPNGGLKNHECRLLLERLQELGLVKLPAVRPLGRRGQEECAVGTAYHKGLTLVGRAFNVLQRRADQEVRCPISVDITDFCYGRAEVSADLRIRMVKDQGRVGRLWSKGYRNKNRK